MKITVYRPNQIGGCITEIESRNGTRIIVDVGANLPGVEGEPIDIKALTKDCAGVFITHYHGDHVGEYRSVHKSTDIHIGALAKEIYYTLQTRLSHNKKKGVMEEDLARIKNFKPFCHGIPIKINDLTVTPIRTDHSAFDSYMLLIEDGVKKVLHTGDFRDHGKVGENSLKYLKENVSEVDGLIIEGTMLSRISEGVKAEEQLSAEACEMIKNNKYVFIMCSSTHIDRIAAFYRANKAAGDKLFITDNFQKSVLDIVTANSAEYGDYYDFSESASFNGDLHHKEMVSKGFCMLVRSNKFSRKFVNSRSFKKGQLFIYSMWKGYLDGENYNDKIADIVPDDYKYLHTSGHATEEAICKVCGIVGAPLIMPIHSERTDRFEELKKQGSIAGEVRRLGSGKSVKV